MKLIDNLNWRYATRQFDSNKKVSNDDLQLLMEAIRLAPSSYGLQLYKVLIIEDAETKEKLRAASWDQKQITDSSAVIVFCNYKEVTGEHVDDYLRLKAETENISFNDLKGYSDFMKNVVAKMDERERDSWTKRQTYIALGILLTAAAELKIDACPMEGFESDKYNEILGLEEQNLNAAVVAAIGYRSADDEGQYAPKVRKSTEDLFEIRGNKTLRKAV